MQFSITVEQLEDWLEAAEDSRLGQIDVVIKTRLGSDFYQARVELDHIDWLEGDNGEVIAEVYVENKGRS